MKLIQSQKSKNDFYLPIELIEIIISFCRCKITFMNLLLLDKYFYASMNNSIFDKYISLISHRYSSKIEKCQTKNTSKKLRFATIALYNYFDVEEINSLYFSHLRKIIFFDVNCLKEIIMKFGKTQKIHYKFHNMNCTVVSFEQNKIVITTYLNVSQYIPSPKYLEHVDPMFYDKKYKESNIKNVCPYVALLILRIKFAEIYKK